MVRCRDNPTMCSVAHIRPLVFAIESAEATVAPRVFRSWLRRVYLSAHRLRADETDCMRPNEVDSRPVVSIYRELQHELEENVCTNPTRPAAGRGKRRAADGRRTRQSIVDWQEDGDGPVLKRVSYVGFCWQLCRSRRVERHFVSTSCSRDS